MKSIDIKNIKHLEKNFTEPRQITLISETINPIKLIFQNLKKRMIFESALNSILLEKVIIYKKDIFIKTKLKESRNFI